MRLLLIGNFPPDRQESMLRFGTLLETALRARGQSVTTWCPAPALVRLLPRYRYNGFAKLCGYFDKFVVFPRLVRRRLASARERGRLPDLVHIVDHANAVYSPLFRGLPHLATCHDLLQIRAARGEFPAHRLTARGCRYQEWILRSIAQLPHAACISSQTAADVVRLAHLPPASLSVIFNGLNFPFAPVPAEEARAALGGLLQARQLPATSLNPDGGGYLLNIGGGQWYKNRAGLLAIYAALRPLLPHPPRLVFVGKPLNAELAATVRDLGLSAHVLQLGSVDGPQLRALYSQAEGLLFPSLHEGFGWPIVEAQACGCPVFTSNRAPMTEVGGDAASYVDPLEPAAAAAHIAATWPQRATLRTRGLARAPLFDPTVMVDHYLALYRRLTAAAAAKP
ncbi:glycosyltransferase family 4 protein [Horticoccus luteus]|uniref:Glycosyltransferase family 4 protein n=1 Tax=Horticoccus luteus TaxID=2862869 RepID=A0A8F9TZT8_9BACT|nr:glycosyltransferase family 4 protein [Horticoccus luteus]